jgi:hypothetical protein
MKKAFSFSLFVLLLSISFYWYSCKKVSSENVIKPEEVAITSEASRVIITILKTNMEKLNAVVKGTGGLATRDSGWVAFPIYKPPVNVGGMLSFFSMNDYNSFIDAVDLLEDAWAYPAPAINYEDTPAEIYHLGEEPLNALDSALTFKSLRYKYEKYDFYNHDWADTASINVEDDDYQIVSNEKYEVKIGTDYYKYVASNIIAVVKNANTKALDSVRIFGYFYNHSDVSYYNDDSGTYVKPAGTQQPLGGCNDFDIYAFADNLTPQSTINLWTVELGFAGYYSTSFLSSPSVLGDYTINWGDGSAIESFRDFFYSPKRRRHVYNQTVAPGNSVQKQIIVTCRMVNPTQSELFYCANPTTLLLSQSASVTLTHPPPIDCLWGHYKRKFNGQQQYAGSVLYRLECTMTQKTSPFIGFPKLKIKATFTKRKGNRWKKTKPVNSVILKLRGDVYNTTYCDVASGTCVSLYKRLNEMKSTSNKKTLKLKVKGLPCFTTNRIMPFAINADFIWTYNQNQSLAGNYNELIKP